MFLLRRPTARALDAFVDAAQRLSLTYAPIGLARDPSPRGFRVAEVGAVLGHGEQVFARAAEALSKWREFDLGWVAIYPPDAPVAPGSNVAVVARHFGCWSVNACRVVYLVGEGAGGDGGREGGDGGRRDGGGGDGGRERGDGGRRDAGAGGDGGRSGDGGRIAGFAYGTLSDHAETGEEIFTVAMNANTGAVTYTIRAVSREHAVLAKLGAPVARMFQDRFRRDSVDAMRRYVAATA
jgi:uncharacterized protein (UPF0548 family)